VLAELESGGESANHMEQIALDMGNLLVNEFPSLAHRADELRDGGLVARMRTGGRIMLAELGLEGVAAGINWSSDTARGWAAMAVGQATDLRLSRRFRMIRPFADDGHFAVREWAWLSVRPDVVNDVCAAVGVLGSWTSEPSLRLRRFATESTRPCGVWSAHIPLLKVAPEIGLPLLEPLKADPSRYVQDSVSNWLNDASKSSPDWVEALCARWMSDSPMDSTERICRRSLRTLARCPAQDS
jgi:3-methyladenine DNA glycosylase AlkC